MTEAPPRFPDGKPSRTFLFVWSLVSSIAAGMFAFMALLLLLRVRQLETVDATSPKAGTQDEVVSGTRKGRNALEAGVDSKDFAESNTVSIVFDEEESENGLRLLKTQRDGLT